MEVKKRIKKCDFFYFFLAEIRKACIFALAKAENIPP